LSRIVIFFAIGALIAPCLAQGTVADASPVQKASSHYRAAEAHRNLALKYLEEAADRNLDDRLVQAQVEFDRAAEEYLSDASSVDGEVGEAQRIIWASSGLLSAYHALAALRLLLEHPEVQYDPEIQRIKADALLALGSGKEAGLAYEQWIGQGACKSSYRNWPGEPRLGHPIVLMMPKSANGGCEALAPELRTRLETLQRLFGHPNNLPKKNYRTSPEDTK